MRSWQPVKRPILFSPKSSIWLEPPNINNNFWWTMKNWLNLEKCLLAMANRVHQVQVDRRNKWRPIRQFCVRDAVTKWSIKNGLCLTMSTPSNLMGLDQLYQFSHSLRHLHLPLYRCVSCNKPFENYLRSYAGQFYSFLNSFLWTFFFSSSCQILPCWGRVPFDGSTWCFLRWIARWMRPSIWIEQQGGRRRKCWPIIRLYSRMKRANKIKNGSEH